MTEQIKQTDHITQYNNKILELVNQIKKKRVVSSKAKTLIQFLNNFIIATKTEFSIK